jgi:hypothetical protein
MWFIHVSEDSNGHGSLLAKVAIISNPPLSQPHFEASVRMKLTLPKVGTWSPPGLPKIQSLISGVKTPHIEVFFIPLKRS